MAQTRRGILTAGVLTAAASMVPGAAASALSGLARDRGDGFAAIYRQAYAQFEAAIRPSSEIFWNSHNRAVAEVYARGEALRCAELA